MFSATLIFSYQQIFSVSNSSADSQPGQGLMANGFEALPASRADRTSRLILAETQILDQLDRRTQGPVSTMVAASTGEKKLVPEGEAKAGAEVKKPASEAKTATDAKTTSPEAKAAADAKKPEDETKTATGARTIPPEIKHPDRIYQHPK